MARPRDIGTVAESAVVTYLRPHGWPYAERRALAGAWDLGDITGTPGIVWEVKGGRTAETASDGLISDWLEETERERANAKAFYGILVTKRAGYGPARAASWWAHATLPTLHTLTRSTLGTPEQLTGASVRMHLSTMVTLLRAAGYGEPLVEAVAA